MDCRITYIGGPTALIEVCGLRLLTDPTFDTPGRRYWFGWGTMSRKMKGPAIPADQLGRIDAVLLSHDHHGDNLDDAGRKLLPTAGKVLTTEAGAKRLGGNAVGLANWETATLDTPDGSGIKVTATPARHGPPGSLPFAGHVIGFLLEAPGQKDIWITGDTVWFKGTAEVARRANVGTLIPHLGGVRFAASGPARYTMNAREGLEAALATGAAKVVPIHYEGWKHFKEGRDRIEATFDASGLGDRLVWAQPGVPVEIRA